MGLEELFREEVRTTWMQHLGNVINIAEGTYQEVCHDPLANNRRILAFDIEDVKYTPRELYQAFIDDTELAKKLITRTIHRLCNVYQAFYESIQTDKPLPSQDRSDWLCNAKFDKEYQGSFEEALDKHLQYKIAWYTELSRLIESEQWNSCSEHPVIDSLLNEIRILKTKDWSDPRVEDSFMLKSARKGIKETGEEAVEIALELLTDNERFLRTYRKGRDALKRGDSKALELAGDYIHVLDHIINESVSKVDESAPPEYQGQ